MLPSRCVTPHEPGRSDGALRRRGGQGTGTGGFDHVSTRGSHAKYRKGERTVIIPLHRDLAPGTVRSILRQADWSVDDLKTHLS
ncbi:type II toxin-antitoxin system HicA family toxin [Streptomyces sp. NPDC048717]|uniref:type II toxin-antitoxin system HicA family toxin n=1 Tax=Streptomyces sp. NPDC048717 TaxID=3154928 RepID=UPI00343D162F